MSKIKTIAEHAVDVAAIAGIVLIALEGDAPIEVVGALASIALGKKYMDLKRA